MFCGLGFFGLGFWNLMMYEQCFFQGLWFVVGRLEASQNPQSLGVQVDPKPYASLGFSLNPKLPPWACSVSRVFAVSSVLLFEDSCWLEPISGCVIRLYMVSGLGLCVSSNIDMYIIHTGP